MTWQLFEYTVSCAACLALGVKSLRLRDTRDDPEWRAVQHGWGLTYLGLGIVFGAMLLTTAANGLPDPPREPLDVLLSLVFIAASGIVLLGVMSLIQWGVARRNERRRQGTP